MYIQRLILEDIKEYQKFFPVLLISGARQVGKSTLALHLNIENYITLDDINMYEMAKNWKFWLKFDPLFWLKMTHLQIEIITLNFVIFIL